MPSTHILKVLPFFIVLLAVGCGGEMTHVKGKATFSDGSPVTHGKVVFDSDMYTASGKIKPDGSYSMGATKEGGGIRPGEYQVSIQKDGEDELDSEGNPVPDTFEVDPKFRAAESSGLKCTVEKGKSITYNLSVERKK